MIDVDAETALRVLDECVAERGEDYFYNNGRGVCLYWHGDPEEGEPGCIIGLALHKLGVSSDVLIELDSIMVNPAANVLYQRGIADVSRSARFVFSSAQREQDRARPWGEAVQHAREQYKYETL